MRWIEFECIRCDVRKLAARLYRRESPKGNEFSRRSATISSDKRVSILFPCLKDVKLNIFILYIWSGFEVFPHSLPLQSRGLQTPN